MMGQSRRGIHSLSVSFQENDKIIPHINIELFEDDEFELTWYSKTEIAAFRHDCIETARAIPLCSLLQDTAENICLRGLEYRTYEGARLRLRRKLSAWDAVGNEQEFQRESGYVDAISLAETYKLSTVESLRDAHLMALRDESYVNKHCT